MQRLWFRLAIFFSSFAAAGAAGHAESAGEKTATNSIGMKLVLIPAGEFMMGECRDDVFQGNWSAHRVRITKPFYLAVTEVTQGQYQQIMGTNPSEYKSKDTMEHPVQKVTWDDAVQFCQRLSQKEGETYRLPTEAEWEYACRAGSSRTWCFGNEKSTLDEYAWYDKNNSHRTHPVGKKKPNAWGLYDMYGNVSEWCADRRAGNSYYENSPTDDPGGPGPDARSASLELRVTRGGSFNGNIVDCRSAGCRGVSAKVGLDNVGFRVVRVVAESRGALRQWTDSSGTYHLEAEYMGTEDGKAQMKRADGKILAIPLEKLSAQDRDFIRLQKR